MPTTGVSASPLPTTRMRLFSMRTVRVDAKGNSVASVVVTRIPRSSFGGKEPASTAMSLSAIRMSPLPLMYSITSPSCWLRNVLLRTTKLEDMLIHRPMACVPC